MATQTTTKTFGPFTGYKNDMTVVYRTNTGTITVEVEIDADDWVTVATFEAGVTGAETVYSKFVKFRVVPTGDAEYQVYGVN